MATDALPVKGLRQIKLGVQAMAGKTAETFSTFGEFNFVISGLEDVMAVLAPETCLRMVSMRKYHFRSCFLPPNLRII